MEHELRIVRDELSALHAYVDTLAHKVQTTESSVAELVKARPRSGGKPSLSVDVARARRSPRSSRTSKRTLRLGAGVRSPSITAGDSSSVPPSPSEPDTATPTPGQSPTWINSNPPSPAIARRRDDTSLSPPAHRKQQWSPKTPLSATRRGGFVGGASAVVADNPSSPLRVDRDRRAQPLYGSPSGFHPTPPTIAIANTPATPASIEAEAAVLTPSTGGGLASANVRSFGEAIERPSLSRQGSAGGSSTSSSRSRSGDTCMQILPAAVKVRPEAGALD